MPRNCIHARNSGQQEYHDVQKELARDFTREQRRACIAAFTRRAALLHCRPQGGTHRLQPRRRSVLVLCSGIT
eukprot:10629-Eustigmatos_ZCMA.PRE.1